MRALNFDDIIKIKDFKFDILLDEKSYENILTCVKFCNKTLFGVKPQFDMLMMPTHNGRR